MIIYELQIEDLEDGSWLFTTEELAKVAAEKSMRTSLREQFGLEPAQVFEFFWQDARLHVKNMVPEGTAYVVRSRILNTQVDW